MRNRKPAETSVPNDGAELLQARAAVQDLAEDELLGDDDADAHGDDHGGVAEREEVPEAERPRPAGALPLVHLLAGGVVDHRDVVGVEGVPQAERVGQHADADAEAPVVRRYHERDEDAEAEHVQGEDRGVHQRYPAPLGRGHGRERLADHRGEPELLGLSSPLTLRPTSSLTAARPACQLRTLT